MSGLTEVARVELGLDVHALSVYWHQSGIHHRITEEHGEQVIYADSDAAREVIRADLQRYRQGELQLRLERREKPLGPSFAHYVPVYPVTLALVVLSVIGFILTELEVDAVINLLVIQNIDESPVPALLGISARISTEEYLAHGQYWRLVTPIFLHFGWVHITFNMLWLWELGRRIESQGGSLHLLCVVLVVGIASNLYQAGSTPLAYFGGMSGVIYGLLGYCGVFYLIVPSRAFLLPMPIYVVMLLSLLVGYLGLFDFLAQMANTAHLSGLMIGLLMGLGSAVVYRFFPAKN